MNPPPEPAPGTPVNPSPGTLPTPLTKRDYFAVHLYQAAISNLSLNCSLQDKAKHAVDAADALMKALDEKGE